MNRVELWEKLQLADLVSGELPEQQGTPWYVRAMLGVVGWIGALFMLGFVGLLFSSALENPVVAALIGSVCCGVACAAHRSPGKGDLVGQFALALGFVGQALLLFAIFDAFKDIKFICYFLAFCLELALTLVMPNFIQRVFTTFAASLVLFFGFAEAGLHGVSLPLVTALCALVWRKEIKLAGRSALWQPVGYGLLLGVIQQAITALFAGDKMHSFGGGNWLSMNEIAVSTVLVAFIVLAVTVDILQELSVKSFSRGGIAILTCVTVVLAASFWAHGLAVACLVLILGFAGGNRVIFGLGVALLLFFISRYYYQMQETLLFKSMVLGGIGVFLLSVRLVLRRLFPLWEGQDA